MAILQGNPFNGKKPDICYIRLEFKGNGSNKFYEIVLTANDRSLHNTYHLIGRWGSIGTKKSQSKTYAPSVSLDRAWQEAQILFCKKYGKGYKITAANFGVDNPKDAEIVKQKQQELRTNNRFSNLL